MNESTLWYAEQLNHYFPVYQSFDVDIQGNILHAAQFCILCIAVKDFLCKQHIWCNALGIWCNGRTKFLGSDTNRPLCICELFLDQIFVVALFLFPRCTAQEHLQQPY